MTEFLAVDWGTTNLRAWRVDSQGEIVKSCALALGVSKIASGAAEQVFDQLIRPALSAQRLPALMCGMIGSNLGWRLAPYVDCPAGLDEIVQSLTTLERAPVVRIVPGLRCQGITRAPDVMRGEETQLMGWAQLCGDARGSHLVCHPGTHSKWALMEGGRAVRFATAMTGELFDVLSTYSVLRGDGEANDPEAFQEGLEAAGDGQALATRLFSARARVVGGQSDAVATRSYLSGLLIGAEVAALRSIFDPAARASTWVLGATHLRWRYVQAFRRWGHEPMEIDGEKAAVAGLIALARRGALDDAR